MDANKLTCLLFNDLYPWERKVFETLIEGLSSSMKVETIWVTEAQRRFFTKKLEGNFWILSKHWRRAIHFLSAHHYRAGKLFVSVLDLNDEDKTIYRLSLQAVLAKLPKTLTLLSHSPTEYRFLKEIKRVPQERLQRLALPVMTPRKNKNKVSQKTFQVGTLCHFVQESNIPFLLGVAHFVTKIDPDIKFHILGGGPLYGHFAKMVSDLDLEKRVNIIETVSDELLSHLDSFLYTPLRDPHFVPLILAAYHQIPVISVDIDGVRDLITSEKSGVVLPNYEIKSMGQKILELKNDVNQRHLFAENLTLNLKSKFSVDVLLSDYQRVFGGDIDAKKWQAAA